ncbi:MAG: hypothetical protein COB92_03660 [Robiginitomaculum sp.]|nr:MAG: hypothetical protein COB92_03660 [Robiginitomaculum sp.]
MIKKDKCLILIKANPHLSSSHFETVCCAGVGEDGKWRRQYPVSFRILEDAQKFKRWSWIEYNFIKPKNDDRKESQKVQDNSISVIGQAKPKDRTRSLQALTFNSFSKPEENSDSLTLIRPTSSNFSWKRRHPEELARTEAKHTAIANQMSLFSNDTKPLLQCPYSFHFSWVDEYGNEKKHTCDDWESSATFFNRRKFLGSEEAALQSMSETFNQDYPEKGMVLAFSTHSRRIWQWLLVGILRADLPESDLLL